MSAQLLDLLDRPIAFHRAFVSLGAGVSGALILSQAIYWAKRAPTGWFWKTMEEWEAETGLTRTEQETARRKLRKLGVLIERKQGIPCKTWFTVAVDPLQTRLQESCNLGCGNPATSVAGILQTTSEITSETTSKSVEAPLAVAPPKKGTRLPKDWHLSADLRAWAKKSRPDVNADLEAEKFRDYWHAKAGQAASKLDWPATWRNWIRNAGGGRPQAGGQVGAAAEGDW